MNPPTVSLATAAMLDVLLRQFPTLSSHIPAWSQEEQFAPAITWATWLAMGATPQKTMPPINTEPRQRVTIFSRLFAAADTAVSAVPLQPLALEEAVLFPAERMPGADIAAAYAGLERDLVDGLGRLSAVHDKQSYLAGVTDLLRRYAWCLPNPYSRHEETAVSLFDHGRTVAALAPCFQPDGGAGGAEVLFIQGDISGVQDFIYTITARGATSGLRGRSLYLQLLTDAIAGFVLRRFKLPPSSLLYSGGGHFILLAPGEATEDKSTELIGSIRREISKILLDTHQGELYLALGAAPFSATEMGRDNFGDSWGKLSSTVSEAKRHRFGELADRDLRELFTAKGSGGDEKSSCQVCHYEGPDVAPDGPGDELIYKCGLCKSLEELGRQFRKATHLLLVEAEPQKGQGSRVWGDILGQFGRQVRVIGPDSKLDSLPTGERSTLWALADEGIGAEPLREEIKLASDIPVIFSQRYMVNVTPTTTLEDEEAYRKAHPNADTADLPRADQVKSFSLLQWQSVGIKRLGVLRMDVDDLGLFFSNGFGANAGLAPTAALSFALELYFEGWVGRLAKEAGGGRDEIYSIYSGGDDLFVVGAWDLLPDLAHNIARDLSRFAAGNPRLHASAGISLHGGKFPLYQAAGAAAAALDRAKEFCANEQRKNAFSFLGQTWPWSDYPDIRGEFERLVDLVEKKEAPRSLLQLLVRLDTLYRQNKREQRLSGQPPEAVYWGRWHWLSAYFLARMARRDKNGEKYGPEVEEMRKRLGGKGFSNIELLGPAARWASLFSRRSSSAEEVKNG